MVATVLLACALLGARAHGFFTEEPFAAATFDDPHALAALLIATALLLLTLGTRRAGVLLGAGFVLGLSLRGALLPFLAMATFVVAQSVLRRGDGRSGRRGTFLSATAILAAFAVELGATKAPSTRVPERLDAQVKYFADRGNVFRARAAAHEWCKKENPPSAGCEAFAKLRRASEQSDAP